MSDIEQAALFATITALVATALLWGIARTGVRGSRIFYLLGFISLAIGAGMDVFLLVGVAGMSNG